MENIPRKGQKLQITCPICGTQLNTWDVKVSKALGYLKCQVCETCICKEYGVSREELRDRMENYFGMRPCKGI